MSTIHNRSKDNFPMVLLTLLSIVQALAFELLWAEIHLHPEFYEFSWTAFSGWVRIIATLVGIILVWLSYAGQSMRFRWQPSTLDSLFPFFIGIVQFIAIDSLGAEHVSRWLLAISVLFAAMTGVVHYIMVRARRDGSNDEFFSITKSATMKDFQLTSIIVSVGILMSLAVYLTESVLLSNICVFITMLVLVIQLIAIDRFWTQSMSNNDSSAQ